MMRPVLSITIAYLLGSIPFGYLIVRATRGADVRESGSGGTGATNVSRKAGKAAGILTLVLDALKGAAAVLVARLIMSGMDDQWLGDFSRLQQIDYWWIAASAIAAILGHMFPVWLGFRGGKGVATGIGVFLILAPLAVVCAAIVFLVIVGLTRYVSLGSIIAAFVIPLFVLAQQRYQPHGGLTTPILAASVVSGVLIVFAHRENIQRLLNGTESKFR
jgi:acyl phosphate:glycerol-3-phosphate acyltransferase